MTWIFRIHGAHNAKLTTFDPTSLTCMTTYQDRNNKPNKKLCPYVWYEVVPCAFAPRFGNTTFNDVHGVLPVPLATSQQPVVWKRDVNTSTEEALWLATHGCIIR